MERMFFYDYRQLRLGKSWVFTDGSSIRIYGGHLVIECLKVLGVGGVPRLIIAVEVLIGIMEIVGMMFMSIRLIGWPFNGDHEEDKLYLPHMVW